MTLLLTCLSAAVAVLLLMASVGAFGRGRRTCAAAAPVMALVEATPRASLRPALQTSAALMAVALALDVSTGAQLAATVEPDGVYVAASAAPLQFFEAGPAAWTPVEPAADWAFKAVNATDGWLI